MRRTVIANTMNDGKLIVHGNCGDIMGYAMRGGEVYIQGYVGYRAGIHMKEYMDKIPLVVVGTKAGDFLGEYMAGGRIVVLGLGLGKDEPVAGKFFGTGMHGGKMFNSRQGEREPDGPRDIAEAAGRGRRGFPEGHR